MNTHSTIWELQGAHMEVLVGHEELGATSGERWKAMEMCV